MDNNLNQREIDSLIKASDNNMLSEWTTLREEYEEKKHRFKNNEVYVIQDYDLFYSTYSLEKLTGNGSVLKRYAYKDSQSFKEFKYFMVLEDYKYKNVNFVSVVGVPTNAINVLDYDYDYLREQELVFLVDATSLSYFCKVTLKDENRHTIQYKKLVKGAAFIDSL